MNHADFTGGFVRSIEKDGPEVWKNLNWVICRTKIPHKANFQFREHYEWRKYDTEFKDVGYVIATCRRGVLTYWSTATLSFHVYWAVAGEFELYGDGGYDNVSPLASHLDFSPRDSSPSLPISVPSVGLLWIVLTVRATE